MLHMASSTLFLTNLLFACALPAGEKWMNRCTSPVLNDEPSSAFPIVVESTNNFLFTSRFLFFAVATLIVC
jgi:hypothetical protein